MIPASSSDSPHAEPVARPLTGVHVVELGHWMAGPLTGGLLADWGADVIKIEPPGGDPMRALFASVGARSDAPNGGFIAANRGKRSLELAVKTEPGRGVLERLLAQADVLITNVRPDALERLGLTPAAVRERFPRLIYCTVSAYGWGGPDQDRPGYDMAAFFARTGISYEITTAGSPPAAMMQGIGDSFTAMSAAAGILAALVERQRTGRGRVVEASLLRAGMWAMAGELGVQAMGGTPRPPYPRHESRTPLYNSYRSGDGRWFFLVGVQANRVLQAVLKAIDRTELLTDDRFKDARSIAKHREQFIAILDAAFAAAPLSYLSRRFDECDVLWAPVQTPADVVEDPQAAAAGGWIRIDGEGGEDGPKSVDAPIRFDGVNRHRAPRAPRVGEHSVQVLAELGYSADEIEALVGHG